MNSGIGDMILANLMSLIRVPVSPATEHARIADAFDGLAGLKGALLAELRQERRLRRVQYEQCRNKVQTFGEAWA